MNSEHTIYLNGNYVPESEARVSVFDQGVLYGDGIFEGIRAYNGRVFKCEEHVDRLYRSAKAVALEIGMNKEAMCGVITETCRRNSLRDGYIKVEVTRGTGDLSLLKLPTPKPTVFCIARELAIYSDEYYANGMPIITSCYRRNKADRIDPQIKSLNYLNNILAKIEAAAAGAGEALMLNEEGLVAECTGDNVFLVVEGRIWTPPVHVGVLDGVTRRTVIDLARGMGIEVLEKPFTLYNLYNADECFLTGTAAEVIAVRSADGRTIGAGRRGPVTLKLTTAFREFAKANGRPIFEREDR